MNILIRFFQITLFQPFFNALILLYIYLPGHDFGIAVIILTVLIKLLLYPLTVKGLRQQRLTAALQPKLDEIKNKYKSNKAEQSKAMMELYKKEKINPMSGCLPLLVQLPIIIALYRVFLGVFKDEIVTANLYSFIANPGVINPTFLGMSLVENKVFVIVLAILAGVAQFYQMKMAKMTNANKDKSKKKDIASSMQTQMLYVFPLISVLLVYKLGAVIGLYWLTTILFSVGEQYLVNKKCDNKSNELYDGQKNTKEN